MTIAGRDAGSADAVTTTASEADGSRQDQATSLTIPIVGGISVRMAANPASGRGYPTKRLQRGLLLFQDDEDLAEEGVGFGVPVLKRRSQTLFPARVELTERRNGPSLEITARYDIRLEERLARRGSPSIHSPLFYAAKNALAGLIRDTPLTRHLLTNVSSAMRWLFGWVTTYEDAGIRAAVQVKYSIEAGSGVIRVDMEAPDLLKLGVTEVAIMNEQGARHFDAYQDADGTTLNEDRIGCWDEVTSESGTFVSHDRRVSFTLRQVRGTRLFRGRELVGSRLAWCGFGYTFAPTREKFSYDIGIETLG
jgi:hypothetical protein